MIRRIYFIVILIFFNAASRLIPHPPNATSLVTMSLFTGQQLSRRISFIVLLVSLLLSDLLLHFLIGYPIFGAWTFFSYSAFTVIVWLGRKLPKGFSTHLFFYITGSSLAFWLWTNFGTFIFSSLYTHTLNGFFECYIAALPFLRNQLLGDLGWSLVIFGGYELVMRHPRVNSHPIS